MPIINPGTGGGSPGPPGPQGIPGINGISGFDGETGEDGFPIPGSQGTQGSQGIQGVPGINGSQGIPGEDGLSGEDSFIPGPQGLAGTNGTIGRDGARGLDGEDGLSSDDFWPGFNPFIDDPLEQISRIQDQNLTIRPSYSAIVVGPYTINSGKKLTISSGGRFKIEQGAPDTKASISVSQSSSFTLTAGPITQMIGLADTKSTQIVTPKTSGTLLILLQGDVFFNVAMQVSVALYYGVGTPPTSGTTLSTSLYTLGAIGPVGAIQAGDASNMQASAPIALPYSFNVIVRGLLTGVPYWFDLSANNQTPVANATFRDTNFVVLEQ